MRALMFCPVFLVLLYEEKKIRSSNSQAYSFIIKKII